MKRRQQIESLKKSFTRLTRFVEQLMRGKMSCGPVTVQQWYAIESLMAGSQAMASLAAEVGVHQSTLTRIVEKLEKQELITRTRMEANQRSVEVEITDKGRGVYALIDSECSKMISELIELIPQNKRESVIESMELLAEVFNPGNEAFTKIVKECCCRSACSGGGE